MSTSAADLALVQPALQLIKRCTDESNYTVAAAIRTRDQQVVTGINLYHSTGGPCAELVALANARAAGYSADQLETIVAVRYDNGVLAPCGRCKQVISDLAPNIKVLIMESDGTISSQPAEKLLPYAYRWEDSCEADQ